jgi:uncharacterized membrane protein
VVVSVNEERLVRVAADSGTVLALVPRIGDFVPQGAPLLTVHAHPGPAMPDLDAVEPKALKSVAMDAERTMEQDLAFGFRQLTDIAERALSPAVNDPTTASQAVDMMHDLLRTLTTRPWPTGCWRDEHGQCRLLVPQYQLADFLDIAVGEVWHYGAGAAQIPARMARMLDDLQSAALPRYQPVIAAWHQRVACRESPDGEPGPGRHPLSGTQATLRAELAATDCTADEIPGQGTHFPVGLLRSAAQQRECLVG